MEAKEVSEWLTYDKLTGDLYWKKAKGSCTRVGAVAGTVTKTNRRQVVVNGRCYLAHRLAWAITHGKWPDGEIDHIDGNPLNNALSNLRDVDRKTNAENRTKATKRSKSGVLGVRPVAGSKSDKWSATIQVNGKTKVIGRFGCVEDAYQAYVRTKREMHKGCTI